MDLSAFDLKGKVALITGGAHGIGFSIAEGMAKCGATVCFNCSNEGSLEKGLAAYKAAGIDAHGYVADVTDEAAVNAMIAQIKADVGPVDILVNNAGLMKRIPMIEMSHTDFMRVIDVHVGGAFNCSKAVLPDMIAKREGKIINICSMMSELGRETVSAYAAAKGALKMLTKNIASEYGEYNIQCNGMGPGYIATAQTAPLRETQPDGSRHPFDTFICAKTPAGRWGDPEDMVGPCVFLASHASDFVNGQILYADGGIYPEFYLSTNVYEDQDKFKAGTVGAAFKTTSIDHTIHGPSSNLRQVDPNARVVAGYPLQPNGTTIEDKDNFFHYVTPSCWGVFCISKNASPEAVDAACRFLDWGCTDEGVYTLNFGIEGTSFKSWDPETRLKVGYTKEEKEEVPERGYNYISYLCVQQSWADYAKLTFSGATPEEAADYKARYDFLYRGYINYDNIDTYPGYGELKIANAELTTKLNDMMVQYICGNISRDEFTTWLYGEYCPAWESVEEIIENVQGPKA